MFFGGMSIKKDEDLLRNSTPHIVVGTPGRLLALARSKVLNLKNVKFFILDECDKMLSELGMHLIKFLMFTHLKNSNKFTRMLVKFLCLVYKVFFASDMRRDVQEIFRMTPHDKQVMMFSATLTKELRPVCKKFMQDVSYFSSFNMIGVHGIVVC